MYPGAIISCDICGDPHLEGTTENRDGEIVYFCPKCADYRDRKAKYRALMRGDAVRVKWYDTEHAGEVVDLGCSRILDHRIVRIVEEHAINGRVSHELAFTGPDTVQIGNRNYDTIAHMVFAD